MGTDFLCERRLKELDPVLHQLYRSSVFAIDKLLANYKNVFPYFTNHTFEHSAQVINYCNVIAGEENISRLNADELYILLMGACLHDVGMGISSADYRAMSGHVKGLDAYVASHTDQPEGEVIRAFHQEFSAEFIKKYQALFEIPTPEHLYCICQVARGHRKLDLLDTAEFDPQYTLANGAIVRLPYLAGLVKLADELDVTADRNLLFDYNNLDAEWTPMTTMCFKCHRAIKELRVEGESLVLYFSTDEAEVYDEIMHMQEKVWKTFGEFEAAVRQRTDFRLEQTQVFFRCEDR